MNQSKGIPCRLSFGPSKVKHRWNKLPGVGAQRLLTTHDSSDPVEAVSRTAIQVHPGDVVIHGQSIQPYTSAIPLVEGWMDCTYGRCRHESSEVTESKKRSGHRQGAGLVGAARKGFHLCIDPLRTWTLIRTAN